MVKNAVYAQSGGVTSVINGSAYGVIKQCFSSQKIGKIFVGINGINGLINDNLLNMDEQDLKEIDLLRSTPSGAFGSCRKKLYYENEEDFIKLFNTLKKHNIGYFFYNGGNDSMDTALKIHDYAIKNGYDLKVMGIPKTIDNDLYGTDHTPGYGSSAKYIATSIMETSLDTRSMSFDSTKVFVLETMGRHAGWLAGAASLSNLNGNFGPHIILMPEVIFDENKFLSIVENTVLKNNYCSIVVSEGIKNKNGSFVSELDNIDEFGNKQLGGAGNFISNIISLKLKLKTHTAIPDYLQRSAGHLASFVDMNEAELCGSMAVNYAINGNSGYMVSIVRESDDPYYVTYDIVELEKVANNTKYVPKDYISSDGFYVTENFINYAKPLIQGSVQPRFENGLPKYSKFHINE